MQSESLTWRPLTRGNMVGMWGRLILAIRADGKGYYGKVIDVNDEFVELINGNQKQTLRFFDSPTHFASVAGPEKRRATLADSQLFRKDGSNGT